MSNGNCGFGFTMNKKKTLLKFLDFQLGILVKQTRFGAHATRRGGVQKDPVILEMSILLCPM